VLWHLEFIRSFDGPVTCTALPLVRWRDEARLNAIIALMREHGVRVNNPHVDTVEDGKFGGVLPSAVHALKQRFDPLGLLNPGKMRSWPGPAQPAP
jgi:FAD/FMN-containing dehydrogenase